MYRNRMAFLGWGIPVFLTLLLGVFVAPAQGQLRDTSAVASPRGLVHGIGVEFRPEYIFPTNPFLKGEYPDGRPLKQSLSAHLKYSFRYRPGSLRDEVYGGVYQGIGLGYYSFDAPEQLGNPLALYLFQGARIVSFAPRLSLNYEWNFGLSMGWKPYDRENNPHNKMAGSKMNAYLNTNFYLRWLVTPRLALNAGLTLMHFSNGNTSIPNAGLNAAGLKVGMDYCFYRKEDLPAVLRPGGGRRPAFRPYVSYDVVFFGSWRRRGFEVDEGQVPSPEAYPVFGFQFSPMCNLGYKLRLGVSVDGVYDGGSNVKVNKDDISYTGTFERSDIVRPELYEQLALGLSGRVEYVMPFFTVGIGMGANLLGAGEFKAFYQMLSLKIDLSRDVFLHVGYNLQKFRTPNYLMLGVGFRFNNKTITF